MNNRHITKQEELVFTIQSLAHSININGGCVFCNNSGHTDQLSVTIAENKVNYDVKLYRVDYLYYGHDLASSVEEFEEVIDRLKIELERWV